MEVQIKVVAEAVQVLNHDTESCNRVAANQWLVQFQQSPASWDVATSILTSPPPAAAHFELQFFAAQILKRKIENEGCSLQPEAKDGLLNALLLAANRFTSGPPQLLTQICLALSSLLLVCFDKLFYSLQTLQSHQGAVLEMLTVLPEVFQDHTHHHHHTQHQLLSHTPLVIDFLLHQSHNTLPPHSHTHTKILRCLLSWVRLHSSSFLHFPPLAFSYAFFVLLGSSRLLFRDTCQFPPIPSAH